MNERSIFFPYDHCEQLSFYDEQYFPFWHFIYYRRFFSNQNSDTIYFPLTCTKSYKKVFLWKTTSFKTTQHNTARTKSWLPLPVSGSVDLSPASAPSYGSAVDSWQLFGSFQKTKIPVFISVYTYMTNAQKHEFSLFFKINFYPSWN